jgi:ribosomal protein S4
LLWLFKKKRILWHQLSSTYGKNIKNIVYNNCKIKVIFNTKFIAVLRNLELRLNILLLRMCFVKKLLQSNALIYNKKILVNGKIKNKRYLLSVGDLIVYVHKKGFLKRINRVK